MGRIRHHMTRGTALAPVMRRRRPTKRQVAAALAFQQAFARRRRGPGGLGGRQRALAAAGDPFRFRLPKFIRKLQPGKLIAKAVKPLAAIANPIAGALIGGLGQAAGAALTQRFGAQYAPPTPSTLTGPGAPSQDYHDQAPTMPTRYQDQGAGPGVPVLEGTDVTPDDTLPDDTQDDQDQGPDLDAIAQQLEDAGVDTSGMTDDELATVAAMLTQ